MESRWDRFDEEFDPNGEAESRAGEPDLGAQPCERQATGHVDRCPEVAGLPPAEWCASCRARIASDF